MLTEAFKNLDNLRNVGIRDFNANKRIRDGKNASWSSWGASTVFRETGVELTLDNVYHVPEHHHGYSSRIFQSLMYALGKAERYPREVEVLMRHRPLPDGALHVPNFLEPTIAVLRNLKSLLLTVELRTNASHPHTREIVGDVAGRHLRGFLGYTRDLEHLRLNFRKDLVDENESFLQWYV
jgi:hypothetical protein